MCVLRPNEPSLIPSESIDIVLISRFLTSLCSSLRNPIITFFAVTLFRVTFADSASLARGVHRWTLKNGMTTSNCSILSQPRSAASKCEWNWERIYYLTLTRNDISLNFNVMMITLYQNNFRSPWITIQMSNFVCSCLKIHKKFDFEIHLKFECWESLAPISG